MVGVRAGSYVIAVGDYEGMGRKTQTGRRESRLEKKKERDREAQRDTETKGGASERAVSNLDDACVRYCYFGSHVAIWHYAVSWSPCKGEAGQHGFCSRVASAGSLIKIASNGPET